MQQYLLFYTGLDKDPLLVVFIQADNIFYSTFLYVVYVARGIRVVLAIYVEYRIGMGTPECQ